MRIVRCEKIFLSQNEADTWTNFEQILDGLKRESENPNIVDLVSKILSLSNDLWREVEDVE